MQQQFKVGETVPEEGYYVCVPCGNQQYFITGATFPGCLNCLSDEEKTTVEEGMELWEKVNEKTEIPE